MKITEDIINLLEGKGNEASVIYISGGLGGGILSIGYYVDGAFTPLSGASVLETEEQYEIRHGVHMPLWIRLAGSTDPTITVIIKGIS